MKQYSDLILVGFGKHDLREILSWKDDPVKAEDLLSAFVKWPPRYRPAESCEKEEIEACFMYYDWLKKQIYEYEKEIND